MAMIFGCYKTILYPPRFVTVIGNTALVKSEVKYDVIDDADLSPEQVASIIMDLLDKLIADAFTQKLNFFCAIRLNHM